MMDSSVVASPPSSQPAANGPSTNEINLSSDDNKSPVIINNDDNNLVRNKFVEFNDKNNNNNNYNNNNNGEEFSGGGEFNSITRINGNNFPASSTTTNTQTLIETNQSTTSGTTTDTKMKLESPYNEPLLGGFALLRAIQLFNFDIYYLELGYKSSEAARLNRLGKTKEAARIQFSLASFGSSAYKSPGNNGVGEVKEGDEDSGGESGHSCVIKPVYYNTILDDLARYNPLQKYIDKYYLLDNFCTFLKICLSLAAITICFEKTITTIILCLITSTKGDTSLESANSSMGQFVLILVDLSSMYILFCTVFNGHLLWNLLSQRLFLISRQFQYKTMLSLLVLVYLEYLINISFINHLYEWDFTSNNIQSGSYSVFADLRIFVTVQDKENYYIDILLTIFQFARGAIRISPYITINYCIICLTEHISTIRNQHLLTESLKKRRKLKIVVRHKRDNYEGKDLQQNERGKGSSSMAGSGGKKKRVIFATERSSLNGNINSNGSGALTATATTTADHHSPTKSIGSLNSTKNLDNNNKENAYCFNTIQSGISNHKSMFNSSIEMNEYEERVKKEHTIYNNNNSYQSSSSMSFDLYNKNVYSSMEKMSSKEVKQLLLKKIRDFDELESYITNLYIFTGRLNRFMSKQGLFIFFIVHNLVITVTLIVPEAARGGIIMAHVIRALVILIAALPFIFGQSLKRELWLLSKQIDRIIIQQQFTHRRRDNLVRIRELIQDISVNCGGMLNFNVRTGIEYLVVACATAFFIEQEHYKLTRRH